MMTLLVPAFSRTILLLCFFFAYVLIGFSQGVGISENGSPTPDASALLDVQSTTKGVLIPRMTTTERAAIPTPATGLMVFDNTTLSFWYYDGTNWTEIGNATSYSPFDTSNNVVLLNSNVADETTHDFVFGSTQLDDDGNTDHDRRFFFDKSNASFRAGYMTGNEWDEANRGSQSVAFGESNIASGNRAMAWGYNNTVSGDYQATSWGATNLSSANRTTTWGYGNAAWGDDATAWGRSNSVSGEHATGWGEDNTISGDHATAWGEDNTASEEHTTAW